MTEDKVEKPESEGRGCLGIIGIACLWIIGILTLAFIVAPGQVFGGLLIFFYKVFS